MINKRFTYVQKVDNESTLSANEWNALAQDVVDAVDAINNGETSTGSTGNVTIGGSSDNGSHIYVNNKGNLCIETTANNVPTGKKGKINIESKDDIQLKPGDDIMLYSDHREEGKTDEVSVKVMDGSGNNDIPVKLQLNTSEITLTTKDKTGDNANVMDINVNSGTNTKGYLKVRAQAIDLRCEKHGGIALQPMGRDNSSQTLQFHLEGSESTTYDYEEAGKWIKFDAGYIFEHVFSSFSYDSYLFALPTLQGDHQITGIRLWTTNYANPLKTYILDPADPIVMNGIDGQYYYVTFEFTEQELMDLKTQWLNEEITHFYIGGDSVSIPNFDLSSEQRDIHFYGCITEGFMNKIKFEHGGGDGLEFGTFNAEKTSIYTDEYRFKKNGVLKLATRVKQLNPKFVEGDDSTTKYQYVKQNDDFYDIIDSQDPKCTWEDIIKFVHWAKTNAQGPWATN